MFVIFLRMQGHQFQMRKTKKQLWKKQICYQALSEDLWYLPWVQMKCHFQLHFILLKCFRLSYFLYLISTESLNLQRPIPVTGTSETTFLECKDISVKCPKQKSNCRRSKFVFKRCQKTCGACREFKRTIIFNIILLNWNYLYLGKEST